VHIPWESVEARKPGKLERTFPKLIVIVGVILERRISNTA